MYPYYVCKMYGILGFASSFNKKKSCEQNCEVLGVSYKYTINFTCANILGLKYWPVLCMPSVVTFLFYPN